MRHISTLSLLLGLLLVSASFRSEPSGVLTIEIDNIQKAEGTIWVGIYNSETNFLIKEKAILEEIKINQAGTQTIDIPGLKYGQYAVAIFHDENNNGEMDRNLLGIPSEPFAFSKTPKSKWRLPRFDEVKFSFSHPRQKLSAHLKKWWEKN